MDVVWTGLGDQYRPKTYGRSHDLLSSFQGGYRTNPKFCSDRAKNVSNNVGDGDETDDCADAKPSDCDISSSDSNWHSGISSDAVHMKRCWSLRVSTKKPDKRTLVDINIFHQTHAHVNARLLLKTAAQIGVQFTGRLHACSGCSQAKGARYLVRKKASVRTTRRLRRVFAGIVGPKGVKTIESKSYALLLLFRDDFIRLSWIYSLKSKDKASTALQRFLADTRSEGAVETTRSEIGTDVIAECSCVCDENKVRRELTTPGTSELNWCAERSIAMLDAAGSAARLHTKEIFPGLPASLFSS